MTHVQLTYLGGLNPHGKQTTDIAFNVRTELIFVEKCKQTAVIFLKYEQKADGLQKCKQSADFFKKYLPRYISKLDMGHVPRSKRRCRQKLYHDDLYKLHH